jgi:hypothetical protein
MMITKKAIPRRTMLRGLGVTVALPLLDSMVPAATVLAQTPAAPSPRFGFVYVPHGSIMREWTPAQEGANFEFSPILRPLESFRKHVTVLTNLSNYGENGHSVSSAMWLSGTFPSKGSLLKLGTTVDQLIAQRIGRESTFPSMELATEDHSSHLGSCAGDFLCSYMSTISWASASQPLPMEINPRVVFERMFGGDRATPEERRARLAKNRSILDAVAESAQELKARLGVRDQARMAEYMDNVREIERRIVQAERQRDLTGVEAPATPVGIPENWEEHVRLMFDLMHLAYQGNLTRVTSFMMARELSTLSYPQIGVADGHHPVSHNNNIPEQVAKKMKVDIYHLDLFAQFLAKLQATADGDGTLLDHSLSLYGSGMTNGNQHDHENLPTLLVGGGAGTHHGNRHLRMAKSTPLSNLMISLMDKAGIDTDTFGQSSGRVEV